MCNCNCIHIHVYQIKRSHLCPPRSPDLGGTYKEPKEVEVDLVLVRRGAAEASPADGDDPMTGPPAPLAEAHEHVRVFITAVGAHKPNELLLAKQRERVIKADAVAAAAAARRTSEPPLHVFNFFFLSRAFLK